MPPTPPTEQEIEELRIIKVLADAGFTPDQMAKHLKISRATIYRRVERLAELETKLDYAVCR